MGLVSVARVPMQLMPLTWQSTTTPPTEGGWNTLQLTPGDFAFTLALDAAPEADRRHRAETLWGKGFVRNLAVTDGAIEFDGKVTGELLGYDQRLNDLLIGVGLMTAGAEFEFSSSGRPGHYKTTSVGLFPYAAQRFANGGLMWGSLGYSTGKIRSTLTDNGARYRDDLTMHSVIFGGYRPLGTTGGMGGNPGGGEVTAASTQLGLVGDVIVTRAVY